MFNCQLCKKTIGPRAASQVVATEYRSVSYRRWDGDEARGQEISKSAIACRECAEGVIPSYTRELKVVQGKETRKPRLEKTRTPKEEHEDGYRNY
jgi:hypothetical protein